MEQVIETFNAFNKSGDGLITYVELQVLLQTVDPEMTEDNFKLMMKETGAEGKDQMKFVDFLSWLSGDKGAPAVIKAEAGAADTGKGMGEEDDDEDRELDDDDDVAKLIAELDLEKVDLNLDKKINRKEWITIMKELNMDVAEANELFDDIGEECAHLGNPEEGYPLREFLEELKLEIEDLEGLKAIEKAAKIAQTKLDQEEETPPVDNPKVLDPAVDKLVRELDKHQRPATDAWAIFEEGKVPLSKVQAAALNTFGTKKEELVEKVKAFMRTPPLVSSVAGQNACRELCTAEVNRIVEKCKADGTKFTDPEWDMTTAPKPVLWVDKEKPGYDNTVAEPAGYKRLTEIVTDPVLFKGGIKPGDIIQGQIGTCFLLGALGAIVSNNRESIRKFFIKYDVETGVYGVRFCLDGEWTYVIVDDWMPVNSSGNLLYAHSKDPQEVWCPILEKAYCKLHTCYEMCDGGFAAEAVFNFYGGVSGNLAITEAHQKDPLSYFKSLLQARSRGYLLCCFFAPKQEAKKGSGKCGEATFQSGLVGGHCYSVLKVVEALGNYLVVCRNPWGVGEWQGKWSDKNQYGEWTDEMKAAVGYQGGANDGKFYMDINDFIENVGLVNYARPFGPQWKKTTQYKTFQKGPMVATAKWTYTARAADEITVEKGSTVEVKALSAGWWYGNKPGDDKKGYFPGNYVRLNDRPIARFDLVGDRDADVALMSVVVILMQPDATRLRKFYQRKEDGMNYKDTSYSNIQLCIVNPEGKVHLIKRARKREVWGEMKIPGGAGWRIYAYSVDGTGNRFVLRTYVKDGTATLTEVPGADLSEVQAAIAKQ
uniref:Calpain catalytic domain-containing protein n=1 Tax=Pyrodinium bahamense TaxID=73915 RepID=A0A7S0ANK7_9DINO|mmetsp:Transcript_3796/g.10525  ORF Transcript_3796/g.10525 Transcript_3796/m.10525 type:complete len:823 (+) Transcript_3796:140-2608(+)|eukprot:CAMPEP_0179201346 /NCGR_PEP_ID=MMETSP0796-20121207/100207_1 /TAXON_ID=73915 /ORGANISM="Pyrodinium bahamense, Strain pbaha01" /LENGTH=822 /DNA_ID=CAMNT_0020905903 /DNA_START=49 /DNA_END=2517 /DNA_ORIENTATION=+